MTAPTSGLAQERHDTAQVVALDDDIAVGEHDGVVAGARQHIDQVRYLAVGAVTALIGDKLDPVGEFRVDLANGGGGRRQIALRAAHDLHRTAIVLPAEGGEAVGEIGLRAMQWLQHRHRGLRVGARRLLVGKADNERSLHQRKDAADEGDGKADAAERQQQRRKARHVG